MGEELYESPVWTSYLSNFASGDVTEEDEETFRQIHKANAVYGKIAEII
ncbi:MAG: hypothetical protein HFG80_08120 [Eubacterium sp.]|nr:hypothetical protein [Eubacterium sp.]